MDKAYQIQAIDFRGDDTYRVTTNGTNFYMDRHELDKLDDFLQSAFRMAGPSYGRSVDVAYWHGAPEPLALTMDDILDIRDMIAEATWCVCAQCGGMGCGVPGCYDGFAQAYGVVGDTVHTA